MNRTSFRAVQAGAAILMVAWQTPAHALSIEERLRALEAQNETLRQQLAGQQTTIDDLKRRLGDSPSPSDSASPDFAKKGGVNLGPVHLSAEGGVGYFRTSGANSVFSSSTFRVDEAKLFLESPVWNNTYFYGELDLVTREAIDENFHLGEMYIDFENILRHWTDQNWLSLRVGRMYIPFGEEYQARYVIDNPLISHSVSDLWGVDEGVELYGKVHDFDYAVAVQNGSVPALHDFNGDKSLAGRIGYNFGKRARVSFSGIRTGKISVANDMLSELWFGNGFFRGIGNPAATTTFEANVFELDAQAFWKSGHLKIAGGYFDYSDNDKTANNSRDGFYYYAEAVQDLAPKLYAAARFSQIHSGEGMPVVGYGDPNNYLFGPLTRDIWRLSLGLGYKLTENLIAKLEYTFEQRSIAGEDDRYQNHFIGAELGFRF